jgi:hypothetical protein
MIDLLEGRRVMNNTPLPDCRLPRRGEGLTSASSHPELVSGYLAIPPRLGSTTFGAGRLRSTGNSRQKFGAVGLLAMAALLTAVVLHGRSTLDDSDAEQRKSARTCIQWHQAAGAAASRLLQSTRDADLLKASDVILRMRRARRNCEDGWITLACQDYHAIAIGAPGLVMISQLFPCARIAGSSGPQN